MLLDTQLGDHSVAAFSTPLLIRTLPESGAFNQSLTEMLLKKEQKHPEYNKGLRASNISGWRSEEDLLDWPEPEIAELKKRIYEGLTGMMALAGGKKKIEADFTVKGWVNINRHLSYNVAHSHPDCHWSGVYYAATGEPDPKYPMSGVIEFRDPRGATTGIRTPGFDFGDCFYGKPVPGMILVFPGWLLHAVHPFYGEGVRIAIAFNCYVNSLKNVD